MIRPEHPFDIRPDLRKAASTKSVSVIRPNQLARVKQRGVNLCMKKVIIHSLPHLFRKQLISCLFLPV